MLRRRRFVVEQGNQGGDTIAPTCVITCDQSSPTPTSPLTFTATFSEDVTGFEVADFGIDEGTKNTFTPVSASVYTLSVVPNALATVTATVAAGVCEDASGNLNTEATPLAIVSTAILVDNFLTDLAAGSVHNTAAEPGPGTRVVVDTENKLSIANDKIVFAGGATIPAYGDPGYWLDAVTRTAGYLMKLELNLSATSLKIISFGWDSDQSGAIATHQMRFKDDATIVYVDGGGNLVTPETFSLNTNYQVILFLRATGFAAFLKGAGYADWTFLLDSRQNTTTPIYPSVANYNSPHSFSKFGVFSDAFPAPLASDSFARANGAAGQTDGLDHPEQNGGSGEAWTGGAITSNTLAITPTEGEELATGTLTIGTWYKITATEADHFYVGCAINETFRAAAATALDANNKVKALTLSTMLATVALDTPDVCIDLKSAALTAKTQSGIVARLDSAATPANYIIAYYDGAGNIKVDEVVSGTPTNLLSVARTYLANARLYLHVRGTKVYFRWANLGEGTRVVSTMATTNVVTGNIHGAFATSAANTFNGICIRAKGTEGQYATALNKFFLTNIHNILAIGDSKTLCSPGNPACFIPLMQTATIDFPEIPARIAQDGLKVTDLDDVIDARLAIAIGTPEYVLLNIGTNDLAVTTDENTFKTAYLYVLDALRTKYPSASIYCMRVWKRANLGYTAQLNGWINDCIALRSANNVHAGPDESVFLEGGDDGATYTLEGTHPNEAGALLTAQQWRTVLGF